VRLPRISVLAVALGLLAGASGQGLAAQRAPARRSSKTPDYTTLRAVLKTSQGDVTLRFHPEAAPNHVKAFVDLAASRFYDGTLFHRVIPGFVIQGGDPLTKDPKQALLWGNGFKADRRGAPVTLAAEFNEIRFKRGVVGMAHMLSDPDSASSQFFIVLQDAPFLDHQWTAFAEVESGMDVVDKLVAESHADTSDPVTGGRPRAYQKLLKVTLVEGEAAPTPGRQPE